MPFDVDGLFTPPDGAENAFPGKVLASAEWNAIFTDISGALTDLAQYAAVGYIFDGAGVAAAPGLGGYIEIPFNCTIVRATLLANIASTSVVDIWKSTYAAYPPTVANTITAGAKPSLGGTLQSQNTTLIGWTKTITQGDILAFNLDSNNNAVKLTISLLMARN